METNDSIKTLRAQRYRLGVYVLIALALLTVAEFAASNFGVTTVWVFLIIAGVKAFLVLRDYMHIGRLFKGEDE